MIVTKEKVRAERRPRSPSLVFRVFLGAFLSGIVLALVIPGLISREIAVPAWLPWAVVLGSVALCAGPEIVRRIRNRGNGAQR